MKIEVLYPEIATLYGDKANMAYLEKCLPDAEFVRTSLTEEPLFVKEDVDLLYLCSMSEKSQELVIDALMPYKEKINRMIDESKTIVLLVGNALEIFGKYIKREDKSEKEALGIFNTYSVRQAPKRFNSLILAQFKDMKLVGYTSRFSQTYKIDEDSSMMKVIKGYGSDGKSNLEGIHYAKVYATYMLGPLLIANPDFTKYLLSQMGIKDATLPLEEEIYKAYDVKLKEYEQSSLKLE